MNVPLLFSFPRVAHRRLRTKAARSVSRSTYAANFKVRNSDPLAKKPTPKCDPYGNQGKPLSLEQLQSYLPTIDTAWTHDRPPTHIKRKFEHSNYLDASKFLSSMAAVCHWNGHFALLTINRELHPKHKTWVVTTTITCQTPLVNGLSVNDLYLAMQFDLESERVKHLWLNS